MKEKAPRLVEVTSLPVFYADNWGKVVVEGNNVRITFIEYRTIGNERVQMPVCELVRPLASIKSGELAAVVADAVGRNVTSVTH